MGPTGTGSGGGSGTVSVVRIAARSSKVEVEGRPGAVLEVRGGTIEAHDDGSVDVTAGTGRLHVTCPEHAIVVVSTASGAVQVSGHVADLRVLTASGRVAVERTVSADVRTRSGSIRVASCVGSCHVVTSSGTVHVGEAHQVGVSADSSRVEIGHVAVAQVRTVSGTIDIGADALGRVDASTVSGKVRVRVPAGTAATMRLKSRSGRIVRDVAEGEGATIDVVTASGTIEVTAA